MKKWLDQYQLGNEVVYNYTSPVLSDNAFVQRFKPLSKQEMIYNKMLNNLPKQNQLEIYEADPETPYRQEYNKNLKRKNKLKAIIKPVIKAADVATDVMQLGNFIPIPQAQIVGEWGNILGAGVDVFQAGMDLSEGNYGSSSINYASAFLPTVIQNPNMLGGYRRSGKYSFGNRSFYNPVDRRYGRMTNKQLMGNRALLGTLGAETIIDLNQKKGGGNVSDNTFVKRPIINKTKEQFKKEAEQYAFNQRVLRDAYPNKFFTSTSNPIETIEKNLPYTLPNGQRKTFDKMNWREKNYVRGNALKQRGKINELPDALNPVQWVGDIAGNLAQAPYESRESNSNFPYVKAIANPLIQGALGFDPLGSAIKVPGKVAQSMESGLLSNTYKLNPWAFKPKESNWYRQVDKAAIDDALESRMIRTRNEEVNSKSLEKFLKSKPGDEVTAPYFSKGKVYFSDNPSRKYLIETGLPNENFQQSYMFTFDKGTGPNSMGAAVLHPDPTLRNIENFNLYKKHWLQGYKEVPKSRFISSSVNDVSTNLIDLQEAQKFAQHYGYEIPQNLERISQSNILTDRTIRGLMNRHNTFVRGVSTNWDEIAKRNPEILRHLEGKGFNLSTEEGSKKAAEYMATHIPISTGYGRASLNNNVFSQGFEGLYTSNSIPTAEGYTYGNGYIVKAKLPTDFSSINRKNWILKNNPEYYEHKLPGDTQTFKINGKLTHTDDLDIGHMYNLESYDNINDFKNRVITDLEERADRFSDIIKRKSGTKEFIENNKNGLNETLKKIEEIKNQKWEKNIDFNIQKKLLKTEHKPNIFGENFGDFGNSAEEIAAALSKSSIEQSKHSSNLLEIIKDIGKKRNQQVYDLMNEQENLLNKTIKTNEENNRLQELENEIRDLIWSGQNEVFEAEVNYLNKHFPGWQDKKNMYAHYIHLGTPGEKILEPIKTIKITPETWNNKSRAHTNYYTNKLSGLANGGIITNKGQWDYPGQTTIIPSNKITMNGVNYPVLGVDNTGYTKMMQPGMDYTFPGQYVTEYPMMQDGGLVKYQSKGEVKTVVLDDRNMLKKFFNLSEDEVKKFNLPIDVYNSYQSNSKTNKGKTWGIASKKNARAYFFDANGNLAVEDEVGFGKDRGEQQPVYYKVMTTPSGTYKMYRPSYNAAVADKLKKGFNSNNFFYMDNLDPNKKLIDVPGSKRFVKQAIHGIPMHLLEERSKYFGNNTLDDNFMSAGCINCKKQFLDNPYFNSFKEGLIYVLPEKQIGGEMIKRADGSYSRRGLWDNLRDNKGSGKAPTKEMLEQERKIKNQYEQGGVVLNAGGEKHKIYVKSTNRGEGAKGHIMVNHPTMDKGMWDTIDLTEKAGATTIAQGVAATKKWHRENPYKKQDGGEQNRFNPLLINKKIWSEPNYVVGPNTEGHYGYNGYDTINYNPNDEIENINNPWWLGHEKYHHYQTLSGNNPKGKRQKELNDKINQMIKKSPTLQFVPEEILIRGIHQDNHHIPGAEDLIYEDPNTLEGAARLYENYIRAGGKPIFANGGYVVRRSHDRKGKTHVVIGPDGTKKYFGDPNMGERSKSKHGKEAFYARHKHNLAKNPYFRAYARATWEEGGETYAIGGQSTLNPITIKDNANWLDFLKN